MAAAATATAAAPMDPPRSPAPAKRRGRPPKNPPAAAAPNSPVSPLEAASGYELERAARIRENMARMQRLGILDLAQTLNHSASAAAAASGGRGRWRKKPVEPGAVAAQTVNPAPQSPARRSLRLKNMEPVRYSDVPTKKEKGSKRFESEFIEKGSKEEIYTEDHEKLLGTCQTAWTLFVDGYDKDGKRIYDQVRGKTCHQCRQKTLGHHTSCSKCQIVQGQFCGDCLYMRYGENVLEAKRNLNWICPVCRGICNCSICRTKRGWFPTGTAYRKVIRLGYKSVAHYLIATKRSSPNLDDSSSADSSNKLPSARSETSCISDHAALVAKESLEDGETSSKAKDKKATYVQVKNSDGYKDNSSSESVVTSDPQDDQTNKDAGCATPSKPAAPKKRKAIERDPDCVASRLRSRAKKPGTAI